MGKSREIQGEFIGEFDARKVLEKTFEILSRRYFPNGEYYIELVNVVENKPTEAAKKE